MRNRLPKDLAAGLGVLVLFVASQVLAQKGGNPMELGAGRPASAKRVPASDAGPHRDAHFEGRMTPEQRRQLRRDVHSHGRDIYHRRSGAKQP